MRTAPGEITVNAPCNCPAWSCSTFATVSAFAVAGKPARRINTIHDSSMDSTEPINQLAKILVLGEQQRASGIGLLENLVVTDARGQLGNVRRVMGILTQSLDNGLIDAFVSEKDHADCLVMGYTMSERSTRAA